MMAAAQDRRRRTGRRTIVFVDEIHRFNKAQQDAFLPRVEAGDIVLIGATTENPSFEVNAALLSRSKVFVLQRLTQEAVERILRRALEDRERGLGALDAEVTPEASVGDRAVRQRRRARRAQPAGVLGRDRADRPGDDGAAARPAAARAVDPAPRPALRQGRRGALQPDLRAAQVDAQQRPGRRRLLGGADARGRRGPALRRAPAGALRLRRHRQRRSAGAGRGGGRQGGGALHRHARRQHRAGPGRDLSGHRAQEQRRLHAPTARPPRTPTPRPPTRCRCTCATRRRS